MKNISSTFSIFNFEDDCPGLTRIIYTCNNPKGEQCESNFVNFKFIERNT